MSGKICKTFIDFDDNHKGLTSPEASMYAERAWDYQQTKLDKAIKALEFYASISTYGSDDISRSTGNRCYDIVLFDLTRDFKTGEDYAGSRARQTLKEIGGEKFKITTTLEVSEEQHKNLLASIEFDRYCAITECSKCPFEKFGRLAECEHAYQKIKELSEKSKNVGVV